jgi:hypothetical protein
VPPIWGSEPNLRGNRFEVRTDRNRGRYLAVQLREVSRWRNDSGCRACSLNGQMLTVFPAGHKLTLTLCQERLMFRHSLLVLGCLTNLECRPG